MAGPAAGWVSVGQIMEDVTQLPPVEKHQVISLLY